MKPGVGAWWWSFGRFGYSSCASLPLLRLRDFVQRIELSSYESVGSSPKVRATCVSERSEVPIAYNQKLPSYGDHYRPADS